MGDNYYNRIINGERTTEFLDYRFSITKSERTTELKEKFKRMCEGSTVGKRQMGLIQDEFRTGILEMCAFTAPSLAAPQDLVVVEVPNRGREAAVRTIKEWGHSTAKITDLFYVTNSGIGLHGSNYQQFTKLLGLRSSVKMHHQLSVSGGTVLRHAKHFAESNRGARILVVCSDITAVVNFHGLFDTRAETWVLRTRAREDATALYVKDLQRRNRDNSARLREVQRENDRLRADKLTLLKWLCETELGDKARRSVSLSHDSSTSGSHRRISASTRVQKRELFLSFSY